VLRGLTKIAAEGRLRLFHLDGGGFSPSLPTGYSSCLPGQRRRVNALAAYEPVGPAPTLHAADFERTLTSDDRVAYLKSLPAATLPRVVVLDNAGIRTSKAVKAARWELSDMGLFLYFLPPYSPELNWIEPDFKQSKHHEMPVRSHKTREELRTAVEEGFAAYRCRLAGESNNHLRSSA